MYGHKQLIGCTASPEHESRFCHKHNNFIVKKQNLGEVQQQKIEEPPQKKIKTHHVHTRKSFRKIIEQLKQDLDEGLAFSSLLLLKFFV